MSFLDNAKIRTKILALIVPLCLAGVSGSAWLSYQFKDADSTYAEFIATDEVAAAEMASANRNLQGLGYRALQSIFYDHKADYYPGIIELYAGNAKQLQARMERSKQLIPEHATAIDALLKGEEPGEGHWAELDLFRPVARVKSRHACVRLPFRTLEAALSAATASS